jgi:hypothetical protein
MRVVVLFLHCSAQLSFGLINIHFFLFDARIPWQPFLSQQCHHCHARSEAASLSEGLLIAIKQYLDFSKDLIMMLLLAISSDSALQALARDEAQIATQPRAYLQIYRLGWATLI